MTTDRQSLINSVLASPDDDLPRLVFADWLDEHGEPRRAEFIRLQCRLARERLRKAERAPLEQGEQELLARCSQRWAHKVVFQHCPPTWRRGFIDGITANGSDLGYVYRYVGWEHPIKAFHVLPWLSEGTSGYPLLGVARSIIWDIGDLSAAEAQELAKRFEKSPLQSLEIRTPNPVPADGRRVLTRKLKDRVTYIVTGGTVVG